MTPTEDELAALEYHDQLQKHIAELEAENDRLKKQVESHRAYLDKITRHRGFHHNLAKAELAKEFKKEGKDGN